MSPVIRALAVMAVLFVPMSGLAATTQSLLKPTTREGSIKLPANPAVVRSRPVLVDLQLLKGKSNQRLTLPLFGTAKLTLVRDRQESLDRKGYVWYGKVAGETRSMAVFSVVGSTVVGHIMTQRGKSYEIRSVGEGVHVLQEIDQSKFPNEGQPLKSTRKLGLKAGEDTSCGSDPPSDIDALVLYTAAARTGAGSTDAMEATVYLALAETNQSYINSAISQRLRLVHTEEVTYTESGDLYTDLPRLQTSGDGFLDNAQSLRDTYGADVVVLIVENAGGLCGLGYMMETVSTAFESSAYAVVGRSCATGYYSFGHEIGHNMGADHDCPNATSTGPYAYNRGYTNTSPTSPATPWRTIMSYQTSPASTRIPYWSNPGVNYPPGDPMGSSTGSCQTDNHQVLNNTALTVANFRCTSPSAANVWMKDTWNDTGAEPDPLTASDDMWKSPYIWVRNSQDTNLTHQHEHQNPETGSTNWIYVKLHNGFSSTTTGNLELYWANASTGLSWPTDWNLLATVNVTSFASHSTRVIEAQWTSVPGTGHYCLVARWVAASDPMAVAETSDIGSNVRNNNNIVWRNVNIVDLLPDMAGDVTFSVRNVSKDRVATSLLIRPGKGEAKRSFLGLGRVAVQLDPELLKGWRLGGKRGRGFVMKGDLALVNAAAGAVFENIVLAGGSSGQVRLTFRRLTSTPRRTYTVDAVQLKTSKTQLLSLAPTKRPPPTIGGVSYEIHTDRTGSKQ